MSVDSNFKNLTVCTRDNPFSKVLEIFYIYKPRARPEEEVRNNVNEPIMYAINDYYNIGHGHDSL